MRRQCDMACRGIECRKDFVFDYHSRRGKLVEECGLAGVGVTDHRHHRDRLRATLPALLPAHLAHGLELALELGDARADAPPVDLQLRLAGTAHANGTANAPSARPARAAADARHGAAAPGEPGQ